MNKFTTLAVFFCACLALGSCNGYGSPAPAPASYGYSAPSSSSYISVGPAPASYGAPAPSSYGQAAPAPASYGQAAPAPASYGQAAPAPASYGQAAPAPASYGQAAPAPASYGQAAPAPASYGKVSNYGQNSDNGAASASAHAGGIYQRPVEIIAGPQLRPILLDSGNGQGQAQGYGQAKAPQYGSNAGSSYGGQQRSYNNRPRWTVQPAGAALLYAGQNNYRSIVSPPEYSKVVLPVRAAPPVAKLWLPQNNHGSYQNAAPKY